MFERACSSLVLFSVLSLLLAAGPVRAGQVEIISRVDPELISDAVGGSATSISSDGRFLAFVSTAGNLLPGQPPPTNAVWTHVYLEDRQTGSRTLVSRSGGSAVTPANDFSSGPVVSADGRFVAYQSMATDLGGGLNGSANAEDIFLYDRVMDTTILVSRSSGSPSTVGRPSTDAVLSADGRYVAFTSQAVDLVPGQNGPGFSRQVFLFDRVTETMALVSHAHGLPAREGGGPSYNAAISADGSWVAFVSWATDLVAGQNTTNANVFLYERATGTVSLASRTNASATSGAGVEPLERLSLSTDGRFVAFTSSDPNISPGQSDPGTDRDVFVFDRVTESTALVSRSHASPVVAGDGGSLSPALSADGRFVAFASQAGDLVAGQTGSALLGNVFLHDLALGTTVLVSRSSADPLAAADGSSLQPRISGDGSFVAFVSMGTNLVPGQSDTALLPDIFLFDRAAGTNRMISRPAGAAVESSDRKSSNPLISTDGNHVAYTSGAADLMAGVVDTNQSDDVFRYSRLVDANTLVSRRDPGSPSVTPVNGLTSQPLVSADGRFVVYSSSAALVVSGQVDTNGVSDVFLFDRLTGTTVLVSHAAGSPNQAGNGDSSPVGSSPIGISPDGRFVTFHSRSTDLVPGQVDGNGHFDIFIYDRLSGTSTLASRSTASPSTAGNSYVLGGKPSPDGRYVPFQSYANDLVPGQSDRAQTQSVFLYDRVTGTTELVSHASGSPVLEPNGDSGSPAVSPDGRYTAFVSSATNLVSGLADTNGVADLFLRDRVTGTTSLLSRNASGNFANGESAAPVFADGGRCIAFFSSARDLVTGITDSNFSWDVFLYSFESGAIILISRAHGAAATANGASFAPAVSGSCAAVAFTSRATNLVPGQLADQTSDLFLREPRVGVTTLLGRTLVTQSSFPLTPPRAAVSSDGRFVAFEAVDPDLVPGQEQRGEPNLFLFDRLNRSSLLASGAGGSPTRTGNAKSSLPALSADGGAAVFESLASDLAAGDFNGRADIFLFSQELAGTDLFTLPPCRLFDTRRPEDGPALASRQPRLVDAVGVCGIPPTARALALNVTVFQPAASGNLVLYPGDEEPPVASTANFAAGTVRANNALVPLALDESRSLGLRAILSGDATVHVILDVTGYFE